MKTTGRKKGSVHEQIMDLRKFARESVGDIRTLCPTCRRPPTIRAAHRLNYPDEQRSGVAERRSILTPADVDHAMIDIEQIVTQAVDNDSIVVSVRESLATARALQLSAYDAVYLDLARRVKLPLATLDEQLRAAAGHAGVELLH